jgi:single-strand DNA-binding protein
MSTFGTTHGHVGRVGEITTAAQSETLAFSVASKRRSKNSDGQWDDVSTWIDCRVWGQQALSLARRLRTGDEVIVSGEIFDDFWNDKNGNKNRSIKLSVNSCQILRHKRTDTDQPHDPQPAPVAAPATQVQADTDQPPF